MHTGYMPLSRLSYLSQDMENILPQLGEYLKLIDSAPHTEMEPM